MCDFTSLLGLSPTVPQCFEGAAPDGYNVSDTGYYINDKDYGMRLMDGCRFAGWPILQQAKAAAIRDFKTDLGALITQNFDKGFTPFTGLIGQTNHSGADVSFSRPFGGVRYSCDGAANDLELVVKSVYLGLNTSGTYTLTVRSNDPEIEDSEKELTAVAGKFTKTTFADGAEIVLPLFSKHFEGTGDDLLHYLTVDYDGAKPLLSKFGCCGNVPGWKRFLAVDGFGASDVDGAALALNGHTNGVVVDAYLRCNTLGFICRLPQIGEFDLESVIGRALQFRAGAVGYGLLIDGGVLNLCTLYNREEIETHRNYLNQKYGEYLQYIVENLPNGCSQCFTCKQSLYFQKASNLL